MIVCVFVCVFGADSFNAKKRNLLPRGLDI